MSNLVYTRSGQYPCRYQPGDRVKGAVTGDHSDQKFIGEIVEGIIVRWLDGDVDCLDKGRVEVRLDDNAFVWIKATEVITVRGKLEHPEATYTPIVRWVCDTCSRSGWGLDQADAESAFKKHQIGF